MASYRQALDWIAYNDDWEWLERDDDPASVTASMVADLWNKSDEQVRADLHRAIKRMRREDQRSLA